MKQDQGWIIQLVLKPISGNQYTGFSVPMLPEHPKIKVITSKRLFLIRFIVQYLGTKV